MDIYKVGLQMLMLGRTRKCLVDTAGRLLERMGAHYVGYIDRWDGWVVGQSIQGVYMDRDRAVPKWMGSLYSFMLEGEVRGRVP